MPPLRQGIAILSLVMALAHYLVGWPLCTQQWGPLWDGVPAVPPSYIKAKSFELPARPCHHSSLTSVIPPTLQAPSGALSVSSIWNALSKSLPYLLRIFAQMQLLRRCPHPEPSLFSTLTTFMCSTFQMIPLVCSLPPLAGIELHEGRDCGMSLSGLGPITYHSRPCAYRHQRRLLAWLAGWLAEGML